jgi:hypothetical protein
MGISLQERVNADLHKGLVRGTRQYEELLGGGKLRILRGHCWPWLEN